MYTLGNDRASIVRAPRDEDLCGGCTELRSNSLHCVVINDLLLVNDIVSERTVRSDVHVVLLAEVEQLVLWVEWMTLDLVHGLGTKWGKLSDDAVLSNENRHIRARHQLPPRCL